VLALFAAMIVLVLLLHWAISGAVLQTLLALLEFLGAALVSIVLAYFLLIHFVSKAGAGIYELKPSEITKEFDLQLRAASSWLYKGNFGRYLRGKVLPDLSKAYAGLSVVACIIDPRNIDLCSKHAGYRGRINSIDKGHAYTESTVALQVLVTIVVCAWYVSNKNMNIRLFLTKTYDPVRVDSNGQSMIVTVEDRRSPALKLDKDYFMFSHFTSQLDTAREQGSEVVFSGFRNCSISDISESDVELVIRGAGLDVVLDRVAAADVARECGQVNNPYES
jgi:hypothetical protein